VKLLWFGSRGLALDSSQRQRLAALPAPAALGEQPPGEQRLVVLDLETSGLNLRRDLVLSIGAVVIEHGAIDLGQQFEVTLQRAAQPLGESVLIHGIAPSALAAGREPAQALLEFLEFLGPSPLLAFHAGFDQRMLARALRQSLGHRLQHSFLDVAELAPMLLPQRRPRHGGLDDWAEALHLQVQQRHHASADALATAEMALMLFRHARNQGIDSLSELAARLDSWRRRERIQRL
jgi:DNA polymerase-3 subunit epsilon